MSHYRSRRRGNRYVYLEKPYWCTPTQLQSHIVTARVAGGACREESRRRKRRQVMSLKPLHPRYCCWLTSGGHPDDAVWVMYVCRPLTREGVGEECKAFVYRHLSV